tara:strand:- start:353 stop:505 length:153 start_codon:yes stop_codon:yes gene_type:complete
MNEQDMQDIREKVERVEKQGHGEVVVKIKNGFIYRILVTEDSLVSNSKGT